MQFNSIRPYQVLPFWARVDVETKVLKRYYALMEPHHQIGGGVLPLLQSSSQCILQP